MEEKADYTVILDFNDDDDDDDDDDDVDDDDVTNNKMFDNSGTAKWLV